MSENSLYGDKWNFIRIEVDNNKELFYTMEVNLW